MYGYIRPRKEELIIREWQRYRAVYCGLCRSLERRYGERARLAVNYDLTFLALFLQAFREEATEIGTTRCLVNPLIKRPLMQANAELDYAADLTVLLAAAKGEDEHRDRAHFKALGFDFLFKSSARKAALARPQLAVAWASCQQDLTEYESLPPSIEAAEPFSRFLSEVFREGARLAPDSMLADSAMVEAAALVGAHLGRWIYWIDALDDWKSDRANGLYNPFASMEFEELIERVPTLLRAEEEALDRTAALLPYVRDAGLLANIICQGLALVREEVMAKICQGISIKSKKTISGL